MTTAQKTRSWLQREWEDDREVFITFTVIILMIIACVVGLIVAAKADAAALAEWKRNCVENLGGRVLSKDASTIGYNSKDGSTVYTPKTDYLCVSQTGGILDIR